MAKKRNRSNRPRPAVAEPRKPGGSRKGDPPPKDSPILASRGPAIDRSSSGPAPSPTPAPKAGRLDESALDELTAAKEIFTKPRSKRDRGRGDAPARGTAIEKPSPGRATDKRPPAREPVFWFGFEVAWAKLATARFVVFGLLALDAFLQIRHAPRYGAGDFNVAQLPMLDGLGAGRVGYTVAQLIEAYLFSLVALGVATRLALPIGTAIYAWLYFGSQLDSYQHHYLVVLVLAIACFVPWQRPTDATPSTPIRTWAIRLVLIQLAIMYLWAAISKMDPAWVGGRTLASQLTGSLRAGLDHTIGLKVASVLVIATELALAVTVWLRPAWRLAAPLGILFHLGIVASGLEIGVFAYLMLALYLLVIPDAVFVWLAETPPVRSLRSAIHQITRASSWAALGVAIVAGLGIARLVRIEYAFGIALALTVVPLAAAAASAQRHPRPTAKIAAAHLAALAFWLVADRASSVAADYASFWGGSQRRLGNTVEAERAYRALLDIDPDRAAGHYYLGRILIKSDRAEEGLAELREAQRLEPARGRAWIEEARWLASKNRVDEAIPKARQATFVEPSNAEARSLLQGLTTNRSAPAQAEADDEPEQP